MLSSRTRENPITWTPMHQELADSESSFGLYVTFDAFPLNGILMLYLCLNCSPIRTSLKYNMAALTSSCPHEAVTFDLTISNSLNNVTCLIQSSTLLFS